MAKQEGERLVPLNALEATDRMGEAAAQTGGGERVRKSDIEDAISMVIYVMGHDAAQVGIGEVTDSFRFDYESLRRLTICMIVMRNGFTVVGSSAPMDARNFDPIVGKTNAYDNAFRQLWPLMAFARLDRKKAPA